MRSKLEKACVHVDAPVLESKLKKEDFPTLGTPVQIPSQYLDFKMLSPNIQTDNANLQVIAWSTKQWLLLLNSFLRRHLRTLLDGAQQG
jgi:hypothetical protein